MNTFSGILSLELFLVALREGEDLNHSKNRLAQ